MEIVCQTYYSINMTEREYWLGFSVFPGVGPKTFQKLLSHFGSAKAVWKANASDLRKAGLGSVLTTKLETFRTEFSTKAYIRKLKEKQVSFLVLTDASYPKLLAEISNPPFLLYIRGKLDFDNANNSTLAIVGTRKVTQYGRDVTAMITQELVQAGCVIVSGLAMGVDAVAHKTAIENSGKTIAVLGSGVDLCYPSSNQSLYNSIIKGHGAIVSEYPLGEPPSKGSFPSRNRIVAGLSQAVVVTEGAEDSGALITAEDAFLNKRKVFAVPGPITSSLSKGPYKLIAKGAKLVTSAKDILNELGIKNHELKIKAKKITGETKDEQKIIDLLQNEPLHFDEIVRETGFDSAKVGTFLSLMEMKGYIKSLDSNIFSLAS